MISFAKPVFTVLKGISVILSTHVIVMVQLFKELWSVLGLTEFSLGTCFTTLTQNHMMAWCYYFSLSQTTALSLYCLPSTLTASKYSYN